MLEITIFCCLIGLIAVTRIPVGFAMLFCGAAGIAALHPRGLAAGLAIAEQQIVSLATNYHFAVLPMFILMGVFVVRSGLASDMFEAARRWLGHVNGGVGMATILGCGFFSALTASSAAAAATMAKIAVPEMDKVNYDKGFSAGAVAAGGTMGILIPPSGALIIYAILVQESITKLFVAGMIPGLLQMLLYAILMFIVGILAPQLAPAGPNHNWRDRIMALGKIWGVVLLFGLIMAGLVAGWFTANEAGGIGAGGAFLFALLRRKLTWKVFVESLAEAARISTMIFVVASGALVFNQFINLSGVAGETVAFIKSLGLQPFEVVLCLIGFYLILGCLMDGFAMLFLTVPIVAPLVAALGFDLVWWGIVTVMIVEIALITPPIGLNIFILRAMLPNVPISRMFKGISPYLVADAIRLSLVLLFPMLALWLPSLL